MIDFNNTSKIFVDTSPFIYYLQNNPYFYTAARSCFKQAYENSSQIFSSVLTIEEYLVFPFRENNIALANSFNEFAENANIDFLLPTKEAAVKAAKLRADFPRFKAMDALQLAIAIENDCDVFLTNDKQLKQCKEIDVVLVEEF